MTDIPLDKVIPVKRMVNPFSVKQTLPEDFHGVIDGGSGDVEFHLFHKQMKVPCVNKYYICPACELGLNEKITKGFDLYVRNKEVYLVTNNKTTYNKSNNLITLLSIFDKRYTNPFSHRAYKNYGVYPAYLMNYGYTTYNTIKSELLLALASLK
jgi:hypothetical protein